MVSPSTTCRTLVGLTVRAVTGSMSTNHSREGLKAVSLRRESKTRYVLYELRRTKRTRYCFLYPLRGQAAGGGSPTSGERHSTRWTRDKFPHKSRGRFQDIHLRCSLRAVICRRVPPPVYQDPTAKSKLAAGLLGIFLGWLGIHRFYLGYNNIAIAQLCVGVIGVVLVALHLRIGLAWR